VVSTTSRLPSQEPVENPSYVCRALAAGRGRPSIHTVRAISRLAGSGRPDPGKTPEPTIQPPPEWVGATAAT
jgi:hypothetical protein